MGKFQFIPYGLALSQFKPQSFIYYIYTSVVWNFGVFGLKRNYWVLFKLIDFVFCGKIYPKLSKFSREWAILLVISCKHFSSKKKRGCNLVWHTGLLKEKVQLQGNSKVIVMKFPSFLLGKLHLSCSGYNMVHSLWIP